jgi:N-acetylglucosaminyldiphosphoundecaprenol N-acetyl-beta-D-mannosaminyltransferase
VVRHVHLFGYDLVAEPTIDPVVTEVVEWSGSPLGIEPVVCTPNVDDIVKLTRAEHAELGVRLRSAHFQLPDGMPLVWASKLLGAPLPARLAGSDLFARVWTTLRDQGRGLVVIAPNEEVARLLEGEHPGCTTVVPPFFDPSSPEEVAPLVTQCLAALDKSSASHLVTGISFPKQQAIGFAVIDACRAEGRAAPLVMFLGASPEFYLGIKKRAPRWMQRAGLEWFHRFVSEPRRLFRRYFVEDPKFAVIVWREWRAQRAAARSGGPA